MCRNDLAGIQMGKQVANDGCFTRSHFARDYDESFTLEQAILQVRIGPFVHSTLVKEPRVGTKLKWLCREAIVGLVHEMETSELMVKADVSGVLDEVANVGAKIHPPDPYGP